MTITPPSSLGLSASDLRGHARHGFQIRRRPYVEHHAAPRPHERQAPLGGHRRRGERPRHRHAIRIDGLLLGPAADNPDVWQAGCDALEKGRLAPVRLEQRHLAVGQRGRERNAGGAAARSHVDDRPLETSDVLQGRQAALDVYAMRLAAVRDRGQPWRLEQLVEPPLEARVLHSAVGRTTT